MPFSHSPTYPLSPLLPPYPPPLTARNNEVNFTLAPIKQKSIIGTLLICQQCQHCEGDKTGKGGIGKGEGGEIGRHLCEGRDRFFSFGKGEGYFRGQRRMVVKVAAGLLERSRVGLLFGVQSLHSRQR